MNFLDLLIVRHAQAVDSNYLTADHERRLTPKGERDAASVGRMRRALNFPSPDLVYSSGYERAEQTLDRVLEGLSLDVVRDSSFSPEGSVEAAWRLICSDVEGRFAGQDATAWIFGHNPNIERLLSHISPSIGALLRPYRKATLTWLRLTRPLDRQKSVQLMAFVPKPFDDRDKSAELDL